jgi:DNA-directed RNA polymerase specialized sigma54-like protein
VKQQIQPKGVNAMTMFEFLMFLLGLLKEKDKLTELINDIVHRFFNKKK